MAVAHNTVHSILLIKSKGRKVLFIDQLLYDIPYKILSDHVNWVLRSSLYLKEIQAPGEWISGGCPGSKSQSWFPNHICLISSSAALGFLCPNREDWGEKNQQQ